MMLQVLAFAIALGTVVPIPARPLDYVTDNAGALSASTADALRTELRTYEQTTGHHIDVWIGQTTGDAPLEDWTIRAAEKWKVGRKGKDDGAILFLFMQDHKIRIEVGYGLESSLTDADASRIINETIRPRMRAGDTDGAVQGGVDRMLTTITPSFAQKIGHAIATPSPMTKSERDSSAAMAIIAFIVVLFILIWVIAIFRYLFLLVTKGPKAAAKAMRGTWYFGGTGAGLSFGSGGGGGGFSGGSFGGGFGGGGASGGW